MVELFPLPNEGVLLPTRSATSRCLKTEYTDHQVRYEVLNSRDAILAKRRNYPLLDSLNSLLILLEESMIYGHLGNIEKAKELFELYYQSVVKEYNDLTENGCKQYLKKGERVIFMGQDITAEKDGYVTLYGADHGHIDYLDELAVSLGLRETV